LKLENWCNIFFACVRTSFAAQGLFLFSLRIKASAQTSNELVQIVMTKDSPSEIWLTNFNAVSTEIGPMELFGFNLGSFADKPSGASLLICMSDLCF